MIFYNLFYKNYSTSLYNKMKILSPKRIILFSIVFTFFFLQNQLLWGQTYEKSTNQTYLDSIIQLLPVLSPEDPITVWLLKMPLDSLPDLVNLSDEEILRYTYQLADKAVSMENDINYKVRKSLDDQIHLKQTYKLAKSDGLSDKTELDSLKSALKTLRSSSSNLLANQKAAKKTSNYALEVTKLEVDDMRKTVHKLREKVVDLATMVQEKTEILVPFEEKQEKVKKVKPKKEKKNKEEVNEISSNNIIIDSLVTDFNAEKTKNVSETNKIPLIKLKTYDIEEDVMLNPPTLGCIFAINMTDEFSGKLLKELKYEEAFRFTNNYMKTHLDGKPHIICESNLSTLGDLALVNMKVTINELNALKSFGGIAKKGICTLKLINGNIINLESVRDEEGVLDEVGGFCVFNMQFATNKSSLKMLQKSELDKVRISWKRGFEEYEIYNVDIFKRQANCLVD
jgi:predicted GNAT family acetyltransferase